MLSSPSSSDEINMGTLLFPLTTTGATEEASDEADADTDDELVAEDAMD